MNAMTKYRHYPTEVDAVQYTGANFAEIEAFVGEDGFRRPYDDVHQAFLFVAANDGWLPLPDGQWVLHGGAGFYPCKPDIFEATYDVVTAEREAEKYSDDWTGVSFKVGDRVKHWSSRKSGKVLRIFQPAPRARWRLELQGFSEPVYAADCEKVR